MRHLLKLTDLTQDDFSRIIERGSEHRKNRKHAVTSLQDKTIALVFEKSSTRTRLSFFMAIKELGGNVISLDSSDLQIGRGETIEDTTEVFARYLHGAMVRARSHETLEAMAALNIIPVINGLTDRHHPCQGMADYMTLKQYGFDKKGNSAVKVAFIGEGNNVFNSLALGSVYAGAEIRIASPEGYGPDEEIKKTVNSLGGEIKQFVDPADAVDGADVVYTDVWISMGQESETEERKKIFAPYIIDTDLLKYADPKHIVMHCLPAHRGEEISAEVMDKYKHSIFDQAENRLHIQKAILEWVFEVI